ncbi:hypothetical protein ABT297_19825 [Dactylosporangium sp. NPDC000555]|uniref:hypothetical protein n=1 Tax=Dactylosporangium sp. NPDC000555 TaxID=3154260 RepID=UPI00332CFCB9
MAARSWATSIFAAIGVAAGAGAAQLGLGYGLGIISWQPTGDSATVWVSSLAWVTWLAASSTVIGAICADRLAGAGAPVPADPDSTGGKALMVAWRVVVALAAAVGSLIIVPLVAIPARTPRPDNVAPYFTASGYAIAGLIVGLLVAVGALAARAIAANIIASSAWLWSLAVVAVADVVRADENTATAAQLGTWRFTEATWVHGMVNLPGALLMLAVALVIGVLAAWPAGRRGDNRVGVAVSGMAGPLLVDIAYILATPALGERDQHLSAFVIAPYAVLAGLAGSVIVSVIGPRGSLAKSRAERRAAAAERDSRAAAEYSDWAAALAEADAAEARRHAGDESDTDPLRPPSGSDASWSREPVTVGAELDSATDLESDAYAPSRAYGSAESVGRTHTSAAADPTYIEDTGGEEPAPAGSSSSASASASVGVPLWPTESTTDIAPAKSTSRAKRGRGKPAQ